MYTREEKISRLSNDIAPYKGIVRGVNNRGISHCDEVDMRRRKLQITYDGKEGDIVDLYLDIAKQLESDGY